MVYQVREVNYTENYKEFFAGLSELKIYVEKNYPGVIMMPMYNLDGVRGKVQVITSYSDLGEFQKINDQFDSDEKYMEIIMKIFKDADKNDPVIDHFYRGIP